MTFHFCGYFPKKVTPRPEGYDLPGVVEIASVSNCIAGGPEDWIKSWTFNELGFFDDVGSAESLISESDGSQFQVRLVRRSVRHSLSRDGPTASWL